MFSNCKYTNNMQRNIINAVESLEFVVAQFSWNSWVPLIIEFTLIKFLLNTLMKKGMVCNTPYTINKQSSIYIMNSVNNQIIAPLV